jgi:hypothetical protein
MPMDNIGSYIRTHLEEEAKERVDSELADVSHPRAEEVLAVLQRFFGQRIVIMRQLIKAHRRLGAVIHSHLDSLG